MLSLGFLSRYNENTPKILIRDVILCNQNFKDCSQLQGGKLNCKVRVRMKLKTSWATFTTNLKQETVVN